MFWNNFIFNLNPASDSIDFLFTLRVCLCVRLVLMQHVNIILVIFIGHKYYTVNSQYVKKDRCLTFALHDDSFDRVLIHHFTLPKCWMNMNLTINFVCVLSFRTIYLVVQWFSFVFCNLLFLCAKPLLLLLLFDSFVFVSLSLETYDLPITYTATRSINIKNLMPNSKRASNFISQPERSMFGIVVIVKEPENQYNFLHFG